MGAKASKPVQMATRRFPTRAPGSAIPPSARQAAPRPGATGEVNARGGEPKGVKDDAIRIDGSDPDLDLNAMANPAYAERLRKMGVATPYPTLSNSSTAGPFSNPSPSTPSHTSHTPIDFNPDPIPDSSSAKPAPSTYTEVSHSLNQPPSPSSTSHLNSGPSSRVDAKTRTQPPPSQNRTLTALEARARFQSLAEAEFEDPSKGREFLDAGTLRRALLLRKRGVDDRDIEERLKLKKGVVARMGPPGVAVPVEAAGLNRQTWGGLSE